MRWKQDFSGMTFPLSLVTIKWWYQECYGTFAKEVVKKKYFSTDEHKQCENITLKFAKCNSLQCYQTKVYVQNLFTMQKLEAIRNWRDTISNPITKIIINTMSIF